MNRHPLICLLAAGFAIVCVGADADPAVKADPLPDHWFQMYHTPKFDAFYMNGRSLHETGAGFTMWNKIVFKQLQPAPTGEYQQRILELAVDCAVYKYAVLRDVEYAADGRVLLDSTAGASQFISYTLKKASDDPVINSYVLDDDDVGCHRGE